jgi:hypothetical protein
MHGNIVWRRPDGGISVTTLAVDLDPQEHAAQLLQDANHAGWSVLGVNQDLPADRAFRGAWDHDGSGVTVDIGKARELTKDRLRIERAPLLAILDVAYMRADEAADAAKKAEVAVQKQVLRDVTLPVDGISDLGALLALKCEMPAP